MSISIVVLLYVIEVYANSCFSGKPLFKKHADFEWQLFPSVRYQSECGTPGCTPLGSLDELCNRKKEYMKRQPKQPILLF